MKIIVKITAILIFLAHFATTSHAQEQKNAIGLRLSSWGAVGATFKHYTNENTAIEVNASYRSYSYSYFYNYSSNYIDITGLYEKYANINDIPNLRYFYGAGPAVGFYTYSDGYLGSDAKFRLGLAGVAGLEYKFPSAPVSISADYMPSFTFLGGSYFSGNRGGLAIRYTF